MKDTDENPDSSFVLLILGDGDFTFSLDLARFILQSSTFLCEKSIKLACTGVDSLKDLSEKYRNTPFIQSRLHKLNNQTHPKDESKSLYISVRHEINAIVPLDDNSINETGLRGHHVVFNHPHLGVEDAKLHARFLHHLFESVSRVWLSRRREEDRWIPSFQLTLAKDQCSRWNCLETAARQGFRLVQRNDFLPPPVEDPYYECRRHQSGKSFNSRVDGASESFLFVRENDVRKEPSDSLHLSVFDWRRTIKASNSTVPKTIPGKLNSNSHRCPHCEKEFRELRSLKNHMLSKHESLKRKHDATFPEETSPLRCQYCSREFATRHGLQAHLIAKHQGLHTSISSDPPPSGRDCVELSPSSKVSSDVPRQLFGKCKVCACEFHDATARGDHMKEFLPDQYLANREKKFACSSCGKLFQQDRAKRQHENFCLIRTGDVHR